MSNLTIIEVTKQELEEGDIPSNYVLIETNDSVYGAKTKGGIIYGVDEGITYADADNPTNESHAADLVIPYGTVYRVPSGLYFNEKDKNSMDWETEMELQEGDEVWFSIMDSYNATTLSCEGKFYKFVLYSECYVAKRRNWVDKWAGTKADQVIVLNGMVLIQPLKHEKLSDLDFFSEDKVDLTRGIVKFIGTPNKRYKQKVYVDHPDINVGDEVVLAPKSYPFWLERKAWNAHFDGDELYLVVPRRKVALAI